MSRNAQFIGRGMLWVLTPAVVVFTVILFLFMASHWTPVRLVAAAVLVLVSMCLVLSLVSQERFWWAPRLIAALVCLACAALLARVWLFPSTLRDDMPGTPGMRATLLFLLWGVPALSFLLWGHTRGKLARGDAARITWMDLWTARLLAALFYATLIAVLVYCVRSLLP